MTATEMKTSNKKNEDEIMKIGFVINPIAGVGGRIGLKGSDDATEIWKRLEIGEGKQVSLDRARRFLGTIKEISQEIIFLTFEGEMGETLLHEFDLNYKVVGKQLSVKSTQEDTINAAKEFQKHNVKLIAFIGGDGTACDMYDAVQDTIPLLAIPSGVKMHSACFALNPEIAGMIFKQFSEGQLNLTNAEVMDIDEKAFQEGRLSAELRGMVVIPLLKAAFQGGKMSSPSSFDEKHDQRIIAQRINEDMDLDTLYLLGSGTTCKAVADYLKLDKTLLGIDALYNRNLIGKDLSEVQLLELLKKYDNAKIIVTVIGNQGFVFGRGNQQFSPAVIRKVGIDNIILIATITKLERTEKLRVDTGDVELDKELQGFIRVITSYHEDLLMRIE